jgi:hypothetical protein
MGIEKSGCPKKLVHWIAVEGADFIAGGIAEVGDVELHCGAFADPGWVFDGNAAVLEASRVPGIDLFGAGGCEAQGAAITVAGSPLMGIDRPKVPVAER